MRLSTSSRHPSWTRRAAGSVLLLTEIKATLGPVVDQYGRDDLRRIPPFFDSRCKNHFPLVAFHGRFAISSVEGKGSKSNEYATGICRECECPRISKTVVLLGKLFCSAEPLFCGCSGAKWPSTRDDTTASDPNDEPEG